MLCHAERSRSISSLATHSQRGLSLVGFEEILHYVQNDMVAYCHSALGLIATFALLRMTYSVNEIATPCSKSRNEVEERDKSEGEAKK